MKKEILLCTLVFILFNQLAFGTDQAHSKLEKRPKTNWAVEPSMMLDTLCFLNILTGDPFYVRFYKDEYAKFEPQTTPAARQALANVKRKIKDEKKHIVPALLTLYFSATGDKNLDDMLKTLKDTRKMQAQLKKSPFYNEEEWNTFESVKADLRVIFLFLKDVQFENYWRQNVLPIIRRKIAEIKPDLPKYNIIGEVEKLTHYKFSSDKITAYILHFPKPHGIRVTGLRFIMSDSNAFKGAVFVATHELIHEPVRKLVADSSGDVSSDAEVTSALDSVRGDEFLMDKVKNHNPSLGYNTFEGLVNEDITQALDQIIGEKLGTETEEAHKRWKRFDEGIHVFAVALYSLMKRENFNGERENFREFFLRMIRSEKLTAGKIKLLYDEFYSAYDKSPQ